ncbi:MAG: methylenetetrahydrofolate reductase [Streptococcaceae bacterium]|nr:methylenetetrahydrofolate reductase [Streptococcaceae bacterium]
MKIQDIYKQNKQAKKPTISLEIFPPKKDGNIEIIYQTLEELGDLKPDFISVTYGAGGSGTVNNTLKIAAHIKKHYKIESLHHLTGIMTNYQDMQNMLKAIQKRGIENILALRGDVPINSKNNKSLNTYQYAKELIKDICDFGNFCVGAACYPEGHIEHNTAVENMEYLKQKEEAGAKFFVSQLFFDNDSFYRLLDNARSARICVPITAGIMPILSRLQVERMVFMCGVTLPSKLIKIIHKYEQNIDDLHKAGLEYAFEQIDDLLTYGVDGIHVYTMNRPNVAKFALMRYKE